MKKNISIIGGAVLMGLAVMSCGRGKNDPGRAYMPDMAYSRAYETYAYTLEQREALAKKGIYFSALPVQGTIARGEMAPYTVPNDTTGYTLSAAVTNPLPPLSANDMKEAERLYLVNCAICHGSKLDGNGPLWNDGNGPFTAAPRNLLEDYTKKLADGTMFHVITYGRNQMGAYGPQLDPAQRWMIVHYMRAKQAGGSDSTAAAGTTTAQPADSVGAAR